MRLLIIVKSLLIYSIAYSQSYLSKIDSLAQAYVDSNHSFGLSLAIIDSNKVHYINKGFLSAKKEKQVSENTIYEIGSCTKTMNGLLLANAVVEGKAKLEDYIDDYLKPEVNFKLKLQNKITFQHLVTHCSGLPPLHSSKELANDTNYDSLMPHAHVNEQYAYNLLNNLDSLESQDEFVYSNFGTGLLGLLMERIYSKNWEELFQEKIAQPLNMENSSTLVSDKYSYAIGHDDKDKETPFINPGFMIGAGKVKSNTIDMAKYIRTQLFSDREEIIASQEILKDYDGLLVAYAWYGDYNNGHKVLLHQGDTFGQSSVILFIKDMKIGYVILTNKQKPELRSLMKKINKIIINS